MSLLPNPIRPETSSRIAGADRPLVLWLDCGGGLGVGVGMWLLSDWLSALFRMPMPLFFAIAAANVAYGLFALCIVLNTRRGVALVAALAVANGLWACVCLGMAFTMWGQVSFWGLWHLVSEAAFVATLARFEWRHRARLAGTPDCARVM